MRPPKKVKSSVFVPATEYNNLVDVVTWLMRNAVTAIGDGLTSTPVGVGRGITSTASGDTSFWAKITGNASAGSNQWYYAWKEVTKFEVNYGITDDYWADGTRSGTTAEGGGRALNTIEMMNAATGVQGSGISIANLSGTFAHKPAPTGVIVRMHPNSATGEYLFSYSNQVDGACP